MIIGGHVRIRGFYSRVNNLKLSYSYLPCPKYIFRGEYYKSMTNRSCVTEMPNSGFLKFTKAHILKMTSGSPCIADFTLLTSYFTTNTRKTLKRHFCHDWGNSKNCILLISYWEQNFGQHWLPSWILMSLVISKQFFTNFIVFVILKTYI